MIYLPSLRRSSMPDITIRLARPADAADMADIHARSWSAAYKGIIPRRFIRKTNRTRPELWNRIVTEDNDKHYIILCDGKTVGIMSVGPPKDDDVGDDTYELRGIYLYPDYYRQGIGTFATEYAFNIARNLGKTKMTVWVFAENTNSIDFYTKRGFTADGKTDSRKYGKIVYSIRMIKSL